MEKKEKRVLMVANFSRRGNGPAAYVPDLINSIKEISPDIKIDVLIGAQGAYLTEKEVEANNIYKVMPGRISGFFLKVPKLRVFVWNWLKEKSFNKLVRSKKYDYVVIHSLPSNSDYLVQLAHSSGVKVLLFPWGSEVLRAKGRVINNLNRSFEKADFVRGDSEKFIKDLLERYPRSRKESFVDLTYASPGISKIDEVRGTLSREEMLSSLGLPENRYYIICGYNAYYGQQHKYIIDKIAQIKKDLPQNYLLVFPITYGSESGVCRLDIEKWCDEYGLAYYCFDNYMTDTNVAYLHLISDVFIHVQKTDIANSFIMEALYADTKIINGAWLRYPDLEKFGYPFYSCESIDELPMVLLNAIKCHSIVIDELKDELRKYTWPVVAESWVNFFTREA